MVDNTLATQVRPFQMPDLGQIYGNIQNIQMNRMRMAEAQETAQERNALRGLLSSGVDPYSAEGLAQVRRVAPMLAAPFEQAASQRAYQTAQAGRLRAQTQADQIKTARDLLSGVSNQAQWDAWRRSTVAALPEYADAIPTQFSPQNVQRVAEGAEGLIRRASEATAAARPNEFERALAAAGIRPGTPEFEAAMRGRAEYLRGVRPAPPRAPTVVAPGSSVIDDTGRVLFTAPDRPQDPARERRINDLMATFGVDRATALGVVDGVLRLDTDPVSGQPRSNNLFTGQSRPLNMMAPVAAAPAAAPTALPAAPPAAAPAAPAAAPAAPRQTLYEMAGTPFTTGAAPAVAAAAQGVLGQVGANVVSPEFTERRQAFGNAQGELIRSLAINPRFPVAEMERIRREINIEPGVTTDPQTLQARMRSIDSSLRTRLANEERAAGDTSLPVETRRNAATAANDIRNFLEVLGAPQAGEPPPRSSPRPNPRGTSRTPSETPGEIRTQSGIIIRPIQ